MPPPSDSHSRPPPHCSHSTQVLTGARYTPRFLVSPQPPPFPFEAEMTYLLRSSHESLPKTHDCPPLTLCLQTLNRTVSPLPPQSDKNPSARGEGETPLPTLYNTPGVPPLTSCSLPASPDLAVLSLYLCVLLSPSSQSPLSHLPCPGSPPPPPQSPSSCTFSVPDSVSISSHSCLYLCPRSSVLRDETKGEVGCGEQRGEGGWKIQAEDAQADRLGSLGTSVRAPPRTVWPGPYKQLWPHTENLVSAVTENLYPHPLTWICR